MKLFSLNSVYNFSFSSRRSFSLTKIRIARVSDDRKRSREGEPADGQARPSEACGVYRRGVRVSAYVDVFTDFRRSGSQDGSSSCS